MGLSGPFIFFEYLSTWCCCHIGLKQYLDSTISSSTGHFSKVLHRQGSSSWRLGLPNGLRPAVASGAAVPRGEVEDGTAEGVGPWNEMILIDID